MNENLKSLVELGKNLPSRQEFLKGFGEVVKYVKAIDKRLTGDFEILASTIRGIGKKVADDAKQDAAEIDKRVTKAISDLKTAIDAKLATIRDGEDGEDGYTPTNEELLSLIKPLIPAPIKGEKGDQGEPGIAGAAGASGRPMVGWGAHPLSLYNSSGSVIDDVTRHIKFTGATLSRSPDGVVTVAISGSGGTQVYDEIVAGNTNTFTLAHTPTVGTVRVYGQGQRLIPTTSWTMSGAIITTVDSWTSGQISADYSY